MVITVATTERFHRNRLWIIHGFWHFTEIFLRIMESLNNNYSISLTAMVNEFSPTSWLVSIFEPWRGDRKHTCTTSWIETIYHRNSWEIIVFLCLPRLLLNFFSVYILIEPHNTFTTLQDVNNFTLEKKFLEDWQTSIHFQTYFYQLMKNYEHNKCFTFINLYFSIDLFCYFFIQCQSSAQSYVMLNYESRGVKHCV